MVRVLPRRRGRLLEFHRPEKLGVEYPLKPESISCLQNLSAYRRAPAPGRYPRSRSAAVLVILFVGRDGDLYTLLSRRSDVLRSYPGDTSLPGGKLERIDRSIENAARREAFEEIGLPLDKTKVPLLCILEPFLAGNFTIVTPVVVLITDQTLRVRSISHFPDNYPILNTAEVQSIFSHPLLSFLTTTPLREAEPASQPTFSPSGYEEEEYQKANTTLVQSEFFAPPSSPKSQTTPESRPTSSIYRLKPVESPYHTYQDVLWHGKYVRLHRFLTGRETEGIKPIYGLTAAILIRTAQIGYAREPAFELYAPGQATMSERITTAIREEEDLRKACLEEGIGHYWGLQDDGRKNGRRSKDNNTESSGPKAKKFARL